MDHVFAISLQAQVEKYGAYVGIAAFFGLAVLTVLYFAQAREVKRLREWAGSEPERAQQAATAGVAQTPAGVRAAPVAGAGAVSATEVTEVTEVTEPADAPAAGIPAAATAAGAGTTPATPAPDGERADAGADALGEGESADGTPGEAVAAHGDESGVSTEAPPREDAVVAAATPEEGGHDEHDPVVAGDEYEPATAPTAAPAPLPAVAAVATDPPAGAGAPPGSNGATDSFPDQPIVAAAQLPRLAGAPAAPLRAAPAAAARPASRAFAGSAAGRRPPGAPVLTGRSRARSSRTTILAVGGVIVALAVLILAGTQLLGGKDDPAPRANVVADGASADRGTQGAPAKAPADAAASRARTQVAVLNGTTTAGLALSMAERLQSRGYPEGAKTGNFTPDPAAPDQLRETSTVYYGAGERAQARDVGRLLAISDLKPIDDNLQSLAPRAKVLVIVGADKTG